MKRLLISLLCLIPVTMSAQTDSVPAYRFAYEYRCESMSSDGDLHYLDVLRQGNAAHYYSIVEKNAEKRLAEAIASDNLAVGLGIVQSTKRGMQWEVFWNFPNSEELTFVTTSPSKFHFTEKYQSPEWTLHDESRTILGYECKRADTDFRGRHWTVWYAEELPLPFGPWELGALPGLVLEANDGDSLVSFRLVGAETANVEPFKIDKKFMKTTRKAYNRLLRIHDADPIGYLRDYEGKNYRIYSIRDKNGKERKTFPPKWRIYLEKQKGDSDVKPEDSW